MTNEQMQMLGLMPLLWYIGGAIIFIAIDLSKGKATPPTKKDMCWLAVCCGPLAWAALIMTFVAIGLENLFRRILGKCTINFKII